MVLLHESALRKASKGEFKGRRLVYHIYMSYMAYDIILSFVILHVLFLFYFILKKNMLLCYIILDCIVLYCIALHCIALHCIALYCIALHCIALYCIVLYYIRYVACFAGVGCGGSLGRGGGRGVDLRGQEGRYRESGWRIGAKSSTYYTCSITYMVYIIYMYECFN